MSRRNHNRSNSQPLAADAADTTVVTGAETAPVVDTSDDAIDAALAAIEADTGQPDPEIDPEIEALLAEDAPLTATDATAATAEEVVENLEAVTEEDVQEVIASDAESLLAELDADDADAATTTAAPKKPSTRKKADPATPAAPKRDFHSVAAIDKATLTANLDGNAAQKVAEKAQNLIAAIETGKKLSRYTSVAIKRLVADGKITGKALVETYTGEGLGLGTARAQAQQMTALFRIAGIAQPDATAPKELVIADRGLAEELMKIAA